MLTRAELSKIARSRLRDARVLFAGGRYDGTVYLCGYVVECAMKARVVATLRWDGFPESSKEFQGYASFKTHDLDVLLKLGGREKRVRANHTADYSVVSTWSPEQRYGRVGQFGRQDAADMLAATARLLTVV